MRDAEYEICMTFLEGFAVWKVSLALVCIAVVLFVIALVMRGRS